MLSVTRRVFSSQSTLATGTPLAEQVVTVIGGSGFLGRAVVAALHDRVKEIRVASRKPDPSKFTEHPRVTCVPLDATDARGVITATQGSTSVINLVGILYETPQQSFLDAHVRIARNVAEACAANRAENLVHVSSIGSEADAPSRYSQTKAQAEREAKVIFPNITILRPSIIFGEEDSFFNMFDQMAKFSFMLPLVGGGETRFQPVYVQDVAQAVLKVLSDPTTHGKTFEIGGPRVYTFKELLELMLRVTNRTRLLVPIPFTVASLQGRVLEMLPGRPLLTVDQVESLKRDNVVAPTARTLSDLGIVPRTVEDVLPTYLKP